MERTHAFASSNALSARLLCIDEMQSYFSRIGDERSQNAKGVFLTFTVKPPNGESFRPNGRWRPFDLKVNSHDRQRTHAFAAYHALNARLRGVHEMQTYFSRIGDERSQND